MKFSHIFDVFSRRNKKEVEPFIRNLLTTLRNKILLYCRDLFSNSRSPWGSGDYTGEFWSEIHQMLLYRHGKFQLSSGHPQSRAEDAMSFLLTCTDDEFLDFIEYIFKVKCLFHISLEENVIVAEINELFASENLGYELTGMIKEEVIEPVNAYPFSGEERTVIKTIAYPRVIRKDDHVIHTTTIMPALSLLSEPKYKMANQEYLEALEDYRKGDYGDCLTKCGSAFESVMKIICDTKKWQYKQTDTASTLLSTIINKGGIEPYFEQPLIIIATLRNRLSKSHGAGVMPKQVNQNYAQYALNATAAAIAFLVNETK
jgi:uncharacterized protein DUF7014